MAAATTPPTPFKFPDLVGPTLYGIWPVITSSPIILVAVCLLLLYVAVKIFRAIRWAPFAMAPKDPQRRFGGSERALIMSWAGGRCESHGLLEGRCRATANLHVDHVHPHSKGGSTTVANGQVLCSRHNKAKAARIPFEWELRRIKKRRLAYYPSGVSGAVVRRSK